MKKLIVFLLCALLLCGCGKTETAPESTAPATEPAPEIKLEPLCDGKTLKVLAIGNSFSNNTMENLYDIAVAEGITDVTLGRLYIGSCSLQMHGANALADAPAYTYYKTTNGLWDTSKNVTLLQALQEESWDIITMQQNSGNSGQPATYDGHLERLIDYVNQNKTNPDAKFVWHMTWAYQADSTHKAFSNYGCSQELMYKAIVDATQQKILTNDAFCAVIPAGTAVQNARTSLLGDTLTADGFHLNNMGKLIASYTWYAVLVGKPLEKISLVQFPNVALTEQTKAIVIESVNNALRTPYAVTESTHTA